ncbi:MAG: sigma-70 family RNA polymerase sigma factor [Deltaproteobacteria bacterium]|nr:sigma-70 family RNA polymerase sigma factor [Deltaproteobacteria bacterium]
MQSPSSDDSDDATTQADDARDVSLAARGERGGLAALYDRHAGVMLAIGLRILRSQREAEDLLHDVFVEVWHHVGDYDPRRGTVRTWLLLRMRSRCLDRVRSAGFSRGESLDAREERGLPGRDGVSEQETDVEGAPDRARVKAALAELPDTLREVLELGYFRGFSSSEIGEALGIPTGTVKSRVRVALERLRAALGVA